MCAMPAVPVFGGFFAFIPGCITMCMLHSRFFNHQTVSLASLDKRAQIMTAAMEPKRFKADVHVTSVRSLEGVRLLQRLQARLANPLQDDQLDPLLEELDTIYRTLQLSDGAEIAFKAIETVQQKLQVGAACCAR
jgi:hypothetical protein